MRILVLLNQIETDSYAGSLSKLLIEWLQALSFLIAQPTDESEITKSFERSQNTAVIFYTHKQKLSFFSSLKVRLVIKKAKPDYVVQVAEGKPLLLLLPRLIITNSVEKLINYKARQSTFIVVSSEAEKENAETQNNNPATRITVVPVSAGLLFQPITWSEQQSVKMQYTQGREFYLVLSRGKTQESLTELLKAFSTFKKWQQTNMKLVVLGKLAFKENEDWQEKMSTYKFREDVIWLRGLSQQDSIMVLAGAYGFVHTPIMDNDVVPLLQAMQCATPCISFATSPVEEYADAAAVIIKQNDYEQLAEKMILLYKDEALRSKLIVKGNERSHHYKKEKIFAAFASAFSTLLH